MIAAVDGCNDFDSFIAAMKAAGVKVKRGKHLAFKAPGQERLIRCKSLGDDYTEDAIREKIFGKRIATPKQKIITPPQAQSKPNLLIDIQAKMQNGYGEGYRLWATIFNLKESARTLIFLQERGLTEYEMLVEKAEAATSNHHARIDRIKVIDKRLKEIAELQKHIGVYGKTREVYKQYLSLPPKRREDFFEANRADITLHLAAKKHFDSLNLKKLPAMAALRQEYATLSVEKKKLYSGYKESREEMIALLMAKQNVDRILGEPTQATQNRGRDER